MNAWCMTCGKNVFYEGILPICKNDNGIAVVMAHEIANHGAHLNFYRHTPTHKQGLIA